MPRTSKKAEKKLYVDDIKDIKKEEKDTRYSTTKGFIYK